MKNFHAELVADGTIDIDAPTKGAVSNSMSLLSNMTSTVTTPQSLLKQHASPVDAGMKPFKCNVCEVKFAYKAGWRRHVKNFHADLLASGAITLSTSNPALSARLPPATVPGGISINCTKCNEVFGDIESLQRHVLESHSPSNGAGSDDLEFEELEVQEEEDEEDEDEFEDDGDDGEPLTNFLSVELTDGEDSGSGVKRRMTLEADETDIKRVKAEEDDDDDMVEEITGEESEADD